MHAGLPKYVPFNIKDLETAGFKDGDEVSLESLKERGLINPSGRERSLPLKVIVSFLQLNAFLWNARYSLDVLLQCLSRNFDQLLFVEVMLHYGWYRSGWCVALSMNSEQAQGK